MKKFENISTKPGFMKHNGGLVFRVISKKKYQFKTKIKKIHLNRAGITHGGFLAGIIDAGSGTAVHRAAGNKQVCVTISLDIKFIGSSGIGETIIGDVEIQKVTNSLIFMRCKLSSNKNLIAIGTGVWKKTRRSFIR
ncbi:PaaI family thioesterase [Candidatus Pelagibacter sp.]|jgi:acyl-coenzyme A thioesterase PaaI-like protein|nr:PaaI family thioesterase [Candidatus Pelagibacter sp.]|tara:strand:+ start:890 stop:1300 length:411 start_codon:yes stop_codon:yes gene_type:complete